MSRSLGGSTMALGAAVLLGVSKPAPQSFNAFLQRWLADQVGEQREQTRGSSGSGAGGTWGALIAYVNDQLEDLSLSAYTSMSTIELVDAGVCLVASVQGPTVAEGTPAGRLYFVGIAGDWHYVPQDVMENGRSIAAHAGITLAMASIIRTAFTAGRRLL